ncbi:PREDICTED: uric acid degradation bifunctional protein TTL isoform X2 [Tarenaya hassleriana]|uniref:uric acid degradation bifunctional protein TTL isoform X2 n=1 Tax=Tarenaya hassleriana TaxID=28532 RepID=UPI00053C14D2|nr:PREDICTED: uric acid degradation bifunctional protein TTL isoform X2 [Tarenaya hassleriana]
MAMAIGEEEWLGCCGSSDFAMLMAKASPFPSVESAIEAARDVWLNQLNVKAWLDAFAAHPQIGVSSPSRTLTEQSTALATASASTLHDLSLWNSRYREKFGFIFITCASGRTHSEMLEELKQRYSNRPIFELELAAKEQMKIVELRIAKLFSDKAKISTIPQDRLRIIGGHLNVGSTEAKAEKPVQPSKRTRPPITTHVLDVSQGSPASGVEVVLEVWSGNSSHAGPRFGQGDISGWSMVGASVTDKDGRSGQLMEMVEALNPGTYRISFNTGKYCPGGFFPYVTIAFEVRESQKLEHFHVPLLVSPFSFTTYRGS